jgi:hypothetical protein
VASATQARLWEFFTGLDASRRKSRHRARREPRSSSGASSLAASRGACRSSGPSSRPWRSSRRRCRSPRACAAARGRRRSRRAEELAAARGVVARASRGAARGRVARRALAPQLGAAVARGEPRSLPQLGASSLARAEEPLGGVVARGSRGAARRPLFTRIMVTGARPARREPRSSSEPRPKRAHAKPSSSATRNRAVFELGNCQFPDFSIVLRWSRTYRGEKTYCAPPKGASSIAWRLSDRNRGASSRIGDDPRNTRRASPERPRRLSACETCFTRGPQHAPHLAREAASGRGPRPFSRRGRPSSGSRAHGGRSHA